MDILPPADNACGWCLGSEASLESLAQQAVRGVAAGLLCWGMNEERNLGTYTGERYRCRARAAMGGGEKWEEWWQWVQMQF